MSSKTWQSHKLGEMAEEVRNLFEPKGAEEYPYIGLEHIEQGTLQLNGVGISTDTVSTKKQFNAGQILFGSLRPYFRKVVRPKFNGVCSTDITVIRPEKNCSSRFLHYFIANQDFIDHATNISNGARMPRASWKTLCESEWQFPPLPMQHKIAAILSAYDDLIVNNLRRIKILEQMAQNIYREWFVRFRFHGYRHASFIDSPLGPIPKGWKIMPLGSLVSEHIGGGWGNDIEDDKHTDSAWVIRGTDIPAARFCNFSNVPLRYHTKSNLKSRRLMPGDIVFEVSGGSKGQPLGRSLFISSELLTAFHGAPVICASFCKRIQPDTSQYASEILYLSFLEAYTSGEIEQFQVQSTGISNFKWSDYLEKISRFVPPIALQERFCGFISPLYSEIATLGRANNSLRNTRDLLLPKLISGELDVSELDITVFEEATA